MTKTIYVVYFIDEQMFEIVAAFTSKTKARECIQERIKAGLKYVHGISQVDLYSGWLK